MPARVLATRNPPRHLLRARFSLRRKRIELRARPTRSINAPEKGMN
jgi:hypothetical protein